MGFEWTPQQIERLARMAQAGVPIRQIAGAFSVSRNAVIGALDRHVPDRPNRRPCTRKGGQAPAAAPAPAPRVSLAGPAPATTQQAGVSAALQRQRDDVGHRSKVARALAAASGELAIKEGGRIDARFADGFAGQRGRVRLEKLEAQHCRFPIDTAQGLRFCGHPRMHGAYCADHAARCFDRMPRGR